MILGHHPWQRVGARAAAVLAGRDDPAQLDLADLGGLVDRIVTAATVAARAQRDGPGWGWQLALSAAYPNSPATHPSRGKLTDAELEGRLRDLFAPGAPLGAPCWTCDAPADARWGKALLPMAASPRHIGTQPAGGQPLCRDCRIAWWCLPWGSALTTSSLATATSPDPALEQAIVAGNVRAAKRAVRSHRLPPHPPGRRWIAALLTHPGQLDVERWRNDNRKPVLRQWHVPAWLAAWAAEMHTDPATRPVLREVGHRSQRTLMDALRVEAGRPAEDGIVAMLSRISWSAVEAGRWGEMPSVSRAVWRLAELAPSGR